MKHLLLAACLLPLIVSCKKEVSESEDVMDKGLLAYAEVPKESHRELYGLWAGTSEPVYSETSNEEEELIDSEEISYKMTIKINRIIKDSVFGQSIVLGNQLPLKGILINKEGKLSIRLNEPGKNKLGGKFELSINNDTLQGNWVIYKPNKKLASKKALKLVQKEFVYNPNYMMGDQYYSLAEWDNPVKKEFSYKDKDGNEKVYTDTAYRTSSRELFKINASTDVLTEESLKNLKKFDLEILKNTIYARHGYAFKKKTFRNLFESFEWYVPISDNVDKELTKLEKKNIALLSRLEEYATDHYETFGR